MLSTINKLDRDFLLSADFIACLPPERTRDIAFMPSVLKRVQRWRVSWIRSVKEACADDSKIFYSCFNCMSRFDFPSDKVRSKKMLTTFSTPFSCPFTSPKTDMYSSSHFSLINISKVVNQLMSIEVAILFGGWCFPNDAKCIFLGWWLW